MSAPMSYLILFVRNFFMRVAKLEFYLKTVRDVLVKDQNFENVARILNIIRVLKFILNIWKKDIN